MNKTLVIIASIFTIVIIAVATSWVLSQDGSGTESENSNGSNISDNSTIPDSGETNSSLILWQLDLNHFATDLAVSDGKLFMADNNGGLHCFDSKTGKLVWNTTVVGTEQHRILISENQVYVASNYARVSNFNKDNGTLLWTFQIPHDAVFEMTPSLAIKDNVLFCTTNILSAYDAITGEHLWDVDPLEERFDHFIFIRLGGDFIDGEFMYTIARDLNLPYSESFGAMHFYKINVNTQEIVWCSPLTWNGAYIFLGTPLFNPRVLAKPQGRIIIEVVDQGVSTVNQFFCLDSSTGRELWNTNIGSGGGYFTS
ncbi:MAG: PQQ-like beta-propeller repeat protein, partial [Candidatus Bathyarchaeota archaeon]